MQVNVKEPILNYDETPIKDGDKGGKENLTYLAIFANALNSQRADEIIPAEKKSKIFQLSLKLYSGNEVNLTVDEAALIKERVAIFYPSLVYGRVCELFDGKQETVAAPLDNPLTA